MTTLAYFLTWTSYGTWLPGDARGFVDDEHNQFATPYLEGSSAVREQALLMLKEPAFVLSALDRCDVEDQIRDTCALRKWAIHALNVRTNHVHVVVAASHPAPQHVAGLLKSWGTRRLKASGRHPGRTRFWTNQGSNRYLFDDVSLAAAIAYTNNQ